MVIYEFASSKKTGPVRIRGRQSGRLLLEKHSPWKLTGRVNPDAALPHDLDRATVEEALADFGFQMWRLRKES